MLKPLTSVYLSVLVAPVMLPASVVTLFAALSSEKLPDAPDSNTKPPVTMLPPEL